MIYSYRVYVFVKRKFGQALVVFACVYKMPVPILHQASIDIGRNVPPKTREKTKKGLISLPEKTQKDGDSVFLERSSQKNQAGNKASYNRLKKGAERLEKIFVFQRIKINNSCFILTLANAHNLKPFQKHFS